jgi:tRNA (Thr-GGU) A37 N-methylase
MPTTSNITTAPPEIRLTPIGVIHSQFKQAAGTPIQPCCAANSTGYGVLHEEFTAGLADLAGFDRV